MKCWNFVQNEAEVELRINGVIRQDKSWIAEFFGLTDSNTAANPFVKELKRYSGKNVTVYINSPGGSVFAASMIYNALKEHKGEVNVKIDGLAASAASMIAMAGKKVSMAGTALMMIHLPMTAAEGNKYDLDAGIELLKQAEEAILNAYEEKTGLGRETLRALLNEGNREFWMSAQKAVELGFADEILKDGKEEDLGAMASHMYEVYACAKDGSWLSEALEMDRQWQKKAKARLEMEKMRF